MGLQAVDGLKPSDMLVKAAKKNIEGDLSIDEVQNLIHSYYSHKDQRQQEEIVKHFSRFIANIWQIHPFQEGNTRATAVFAIKYLHSLGFDVTNDIFISNSWYFRNALVRANYSNVLKGIRMNTSFLESFFGNLLSGENNLPINLPINAKDKKLLELLNNNPNLTYNDLARLMNCTRETIRTHLRNLEDKGLIERQGSKKAGSWKVNFQNIQVIL